MRTSKARTRPFVLSCVLMAPPSRKEEPMIATSLGDRGRRVDADLARLEVDLLFVAVHDARP